LPRAQYGYVVSLGGSAKINTQSLHKAVRRFEKFYQTKEMSNSMFLENFQTLISMVEDYRGDNGVDPSGSTKELLAEGITVENSSKESKRKRKASQWPRPITGMWPWPWSC
jgi:hypothetical protein